MEITEFRPKLYDYLKFMDPSTFINTFADSSRQHGDKFELILQDMETAKIDYTKRIELYVATINAR